MEAVNSKPIMMHRGFAKLSAYTLNVVLCSDRVLPISAKLSKGKLLAVEQSFGC
ncbi:hypothetical protein [Pseudoalteromonas rubra]|uniref:hypothetical protein n=1 Tax=Pseudoalteromonas rubra TaxID=43658 RepID=UPI0014872D4F|nr:hypothetical protein [Pseudoalteromonas rubra]